VLHWFLHFFGLDSASGPAYLAWSGVASDISELAIIGAVLAGWRRVNCHVRSCPRIGRAPVEGTPWRVCWRHHPEGKPTHRHIIVRHREHLERSKGDA